MPLLRFPLVPFIALILLLVFPGALAAQTNGSTSGTITGRVFNQGTGQFLRAAVVSIPGSSLSAITESGGSFQLLRVPTGPHRLLVTYEGLDPVELSLNVAPGETLEREIGLTSAVYDKRVVQLGAFVVASEREGNAKAVNEQKNSLDMKNVVAADAFGDVSEGNVGEFLKFMPGVSIDYVEADARSISIGGMDPKYTTVLMDGQAISSAASSGMGRTFELEQLSIASIETVELSKTPTPDVSGSAVAGVVNLRSKGAFDRKGRQIRWGGSLTANSMSMTLARTPGWDDGKHYKLAPNYYVEFSDVFFGNRLGVIAGYNYSFTYAEQKVQQFSYGWDNDPNNNKTEIPRLNSLLFQDSPKPSERSNFNVRLDYKFSPNLSFWTRMDYNTYSARFFGRGMNFTLNTGRTLNGLGGPTDTSTEYSMLSQTNTATTVTINQSGGATRKHGFTSTPAGGFSYKSGNFMMDAQAQYSLSTNWYGDVENGYFNATQTANLTNLTFRFSRPAIKSSATTITQLTGPDWRNLASYPNGFTAQSNPRHGEDLNYSAKVDFRYAAKLGRPVLFKWGVASNEHSREVAYNYNTGQAYVHLGPDKLPNTADDAPALYAEPLYRINFKAGGNLDGLTSMDRFALGREYLAHPDWWTSPTASATLQNRIRSYNLVREQIDAVYLQPIIKLSPRFDLAPGLRIERTRGWGRGPSDRGDALTRLALTGSRTGAVDANSPAYILARYSPVPAFVAPYFSTLKYLHANFRFAKDLIFRASYNESITRPDLNRTFPGITGINDSVDPHIVTLGNPDLRPEMARNIYLSLEYYLPNAGFVSASVARRDMQDLIRNTTFDVPVGGNFAGDPFWDGYRVSSVDNVAKAHNSSLEVNYRSQQLKFLPSYLSGLSVFSNATFIHYDNINNFLRPQALANGGLAYRWRDLSASWRVNWTGTQRTSVDSNVGIANFRDPRTMHDVSAEYRFRRSVTFFLSGRNIFNALTSADYSTRPDVIVRRSYNGAIWNLGVKGVY